VSVGPPRLVIDTNVFVSGLITGSGAPAKILRAIRQNRATHVVSDPIVEEYLRVLDYPRIRKFKNISDEFIATIAAYLIYQTDRVELISSVRMSRDPDDDVFLQTAIDGKATLLISGDKTDLLSLRAIGAIPIVTARDAIVRLGL
jgi:putative PIN family toxin of toxin-antitoxin system